MEARTYRELIQVLKDLHEYCLTRGLKPAYMRLENEAPPDFQREIQAKGIQLQLTPPAMHLHNAAEHAISMSKENFIAG